MYMRLVHARIKPESFSSLRQVYDDTIIPRLHKTPGCMFVGLTVKEPNLDEAYSVTLWDALKFLESYEQSGEYQKNLDAVKPFLSESTVQQIQLSKDLKLEYKPIPEEPTVKSYVFLAQTEEMMPVDEETRKTHLRILSVKIEPGKIDEFRRVYKDEIIPVLREVKGCRYAVLTEDISEKNMAVSVTIWDSKQEADHYEHSGLYEELLEKARHTFSGMYQWKAGLGRHESTQVITSNDLSVCYYSFVTGKNFK